LARRLFKLPRRLLKTLYSDSAKQAKAPAPHRVSKVV